MKKQYEQYLAIKKQLEEIKAESAEEKAKLEAQIKELSESKAALEEQISELESQMGEQQETQNFDKKECLAHCD